MALNGLESQEIREAFQSALSEPGGWFLLKYISRDELEVLTRGNGGVADFRDAVASYTELSPLYGFLRFRRRSVLVRYVPRETSRLIQARVKVHFQSVMEKFSPHDAIFAVAEAAELKETSLSAACCLHAASGSTSSSTSSVRRRRLGEIAEDDEEVRPTTTDSTKPLPPLPYEQVQPSERPSSVFSRANATAESHAGEPRDSVDSRPTSSKSHSPEHSAPTSILPLILSHTSPTSSNYLHRSSLRLDEEFSAMSNPDRQTPRDSYSGSIFSIPPKVKLGPRPSLNVGRRPHTSGSVPSQNERRPVSTLPAGIRMAPRRIQTTTPTSRPRTLMQQSRFPISLPTSPPQIPAIPASSNNTFTRPVTSPGPASPGGMSPLQSAARATTRTPEKQKLMKALELRKKQLDLQSRQAGTSSSPTLEPDFLSPTDVGVHPGPSRSAPSEVATTGPVADDESSLSAQETVAVTTTPSPSDGKVASRAPENSDGLTHSLDGVDNTKPVVGENSQESPSYHQSNAEELEAHAVETEGATSSEHGDQDVTHTEGDMNGKDASLDQNGKADLRAETEDGSPPGPSGAQITCSPVSSNNSTDMSSTKTSTKASSVSDEVQQRSFEAATEEALSDTKPASLAVVADAELLDGTSPVLEASSRENEADKTSRSSEIMAPEDGTTFAAESSDPVLVSSVALSLDGDEAKLDSFRVEVSSIATTDELRLGPDGLSEHALEDKAASPDLDPPEHVDHHSSVSLETTSSGIKNDRSASPDVLHIHPKKQRPVLVDPIRTDISTENSDDNLLSDDSLMDELDSATVQEAKPVSVGKSPLTPMFSGSPDIARRSGAFLSHRAVSSPMPQSGLPGPSQASTVIIPSGIANRSSSGTFLGDGQEKQGALNVIKKVNVSSGISQRIKALERVSSQSSRQISPPLSASSTKSTSPSFATLRKISSQSTSRPISSSAESNNPDWSAMSTSEDVSELTAKSTQDAELRSLSNVPVYSTERTQQQQQGPSTIKRQLVRDIRIFHAQTDQAYQQQRTLTSVSPPQNTVIAEQGKGNPSSTHPADDSNNVEDSSFPLMSPSLTQNSTSSSPKESRRPSLASARSASSRDRIRPKSPQLSSDSSISGMVNGEESRDSKRDSKRASRKSRLFRRVSSISNASRKSIVNALSLAVKEEEPIKASSSTVKARRASIDVGDINVQFPDNLLWKRRCMRLDSQGYIVLTSSRIDEKSKINAKRYHISEFTRPFAPDLDMQEMPNSVVMDFRDGSTLQCACESAAGQAHILSVLIESYNHWVVDSQ